MTEKKRVPPRDVPDRDTYYIGKAFVVASKSKDPRTQVGAVIISAKNKPISDGYNGPPRRIRDELINWDRPDKYPFMIHAEDNAIKHAEGKCLDGATIYITAPPCPACMLDISWTTIERVVYFKPKAQEGSMLGDATLWAQTLEIAQLAGVRLEEFHGNLNWIRDRVKVMEKLGVFG
jgi:dCMP deaminase